MLNARFLYGTIKTLLVHLVLLLLYMLMVVCKYIVLPNCLNKLSYDFWVQEGGGRDKILEVIKHSGVAGQLNKYVL